MLRRMFLGLRVGGVAVLCIQIGAVSAGIADEEYYVAAVLWCIYEVTLSRPRSLCYAAEMVWTMWRYFLSVMIRVSGILELPHLNVFHEEYFCTFRLNTILRLLIGNLMVLDRILRKAAILQSLWNYVNLSLWQCFLRMYNTRGIFCFRKWLRV